ADTPIVDPFDVGTPGATVPSACDAVEPACAHDWRVLDERELARVNPTDPVVVAGSELSSRAGPAAANVDARLEERDTVPPVRVGPLTLLPDGLGVPAGPHVDASVQARVHGSVAGRAVDVPIAASV
ncbi:MAG TPA: hypothetical protein VM681_04335, partial [Candidatus Thermoplasmatota archaeon]|nr:hypothetical protein [Candidatus Thermoplasmatota archaeon]